MQPLKVAGSAFNLKGGHETVHTHAYVHIQYTFMLTH